MVTGFRTAIQRVCTITSCLGKLLEEYISNRAIIDRLICFLAYFVYYGKHILYS